MNAIKNSCIGRQSECGFGSFFAAVSLTIAIVLLGCRENNPNDRVSGGDALVESPFSKMWTSNEELQLLGTHLSPTISAEFTGDGKWIVVSGTDGTTIHNAHSGTCMNWLNGESLEVAPDGTSLLLDPSSGPVELRAIPDGKLIWRLPHEAVANGMHFSDDGQYIVCGYQSLLRIETQEVVYRAAPVYPFDTIGENVLPPIYQETRRHDGRPLTTPHSGLCSPAGRFFIIQTDEDDSSFKPFYSFIHRRTGQRLFSDVATADAVFFHHDDFVFHQGRCYRTEGRELLYSLAEGITSFALSSDETMLAVGWRNGQVAVLDPKSGKERFRLTIEQAVDTRSQKSRELVSLAFSSDSSTLAAVGRKLTIIDAASQTVSEVFNLGPGSRQVGRSETTSPAKIDFAADGSRLLLTVMQGDEYLYRRPKAILFQSADLSKNRSLNALDYFDRAQNLQSVYYNSDASFAIVKQGSGSDSANQLHLWDTQSNEPVFHIPPYEFQWHYRQRSIAPDFPERHVGLGHFRNWYADNLVLHPWAIDEMESKQNTYLPDDAKAWLQTFVQTNPQNRSWWINSQRLDFPKNDWILRFSNNRILCLHDLAGDEIYPADYTPLTHQQTKQLDSVEVPETCWGWGSVRAAAFSPDGSRLLVYRQQGYERDNHMLALFEMPSGKLIRNYEDHTQLGFIQIAPNNRIAAIATDFYREGSIIDLETGVTLMELSHGDKCAFSPDSRYAHVGDRYGKSQSLLTIQTGESVDFRWADRWTFSHNSRYAFGASYTSGAFVELETGAQTEISGQVDRTGMQTLDSTKLTLPYNGNRVLCVEDGRIDLYDVDTAELVASVDPITNASEQVPVNEKGSIAYRPIASNFFYSPDDQEFICLIKGQRGKGQSSDGKGLVVSESTDHSVQLLIGDLETGQSIQCSPPNWSKALLQHQFFTADGSNFITMSADKMTCWKLHPLEIAWQSELATCWIDPETAGRFSSNETLDWTLGYAIHPSDQSILVAADGREAILLCLASGEENQRFGPLPINSVLRFSGDGKYLQVSFRANRSVKLFDTTSGQCVRTIHFTEQGKRRHCFDCTSEFRHEIGNRFCE